MRRALLTTPIAASILAFATVAHADGPPIVEMDPAPSASPPASAPAPAPSSPAAGTASTPSLPAAGPPLMLPIGAVVFGAGYLMGALIVIVPAIDAQSEHPPKVTHPDEKRLGLVPIAGPLLWWSAADKRLGRSEVPLVGIDHAFHRLFGLPYALLASGTQVVGLGMALYGLVRWHLETPATRTAWSRRVTISPTAGGLRVDGTF